eukprot:scaffold24620_cov137-Cylindrotheca_fusiformis.AAC.3
MALPASKEDMTSSSGPSFNEEDYECMLCLRLLFEPTTLKCGHSFCRMCCKSLFQQNHAKCPTCRKVLPVIHSYTSEVISPSFTLCKLLETAFPEEYQQRRAEVLQQSSPSSSNNNSINNNRNYYCDNVIDHAGASETTTTLPLFYLNPMLPRQEIQLNIFEHRYLLMISRCLEGSRHFGMVGFLTRSMVTRLRRARATATAATTTTTSSSSNNERPTTTANNSSSIISEEDDDMGMKYGVEVEIVESSPQLGGTIRIQVRAKRRFVIEGDTWGQDGYTMANVRWLHLPTPSCTTTSSQTVLAEDDNNNHTTTTNEEENEDEASVVSEDEEASENDDVDEYSMTQVMEMAQDLEPLVEEWKALVIGEGWERYPGQLAQIINSIGPMPETRDLAGAVDRALWVGALINPLPGMGVAPEIRHGILEHAAATDGNFVPLLLLVTHALRKSIEYLTPNAVIRTGNKSSGTSTSAAGNTSIGKCSVAALGGLSSPWLFLATDIDAKVNNCSLDHETK